MAMSKATLSTKIQAEIIALYGVADNSARLKQFADAIAKAVVDEIQGLAVVTVTGVQSGGSNATGTIS